MIRLLTRRRLVLVLVVMSISGLLGATLSHVLGDGDKQPKGDLTIDDENWRNHPALDDSVWRGRVGEMHVAADIQDPRIIAEISRRYRLQRQEKYFERLVQHYWNDNEQPRLLGMTRAEVENIFGPISESGTHFWIDGGGRDGLQVWFKEGRVTGAYHVMGY